MRARLVLLAATLAVAGCSGDDGGSAATTTLPPVGEPTTTIAPVEAQPFDAAGPLVIGHRGGADGAEPDNSLAALAGAAERGATWVEIDVRLSADGDVVLSHDPETEDGTVVATTPSAGLGLPTLLEALDVIDEHGLGVDVEIKSDPTEPGYDPNRGVVDATMAVLRARPPVGPVVVSSFDRGAIGRVRELTGDDFPTMLIAAGVGGVEDLVAGLVDEGHDGIVLEQEAATPEVVGPLTGAGLVVWAYTVDDPAVAAQLVDGGVTGLVTDVPQDLVPELG
jgi:glycerophosphoryl diester phosphodiesterase